MDVRFIHVGCHRCGSTFLQERVMPKIAGLNIVTYKTRPDVVPEIDELILCGEPYYEPGQVGQRLREKLTDAGGYALSFEGFSGLNEALGAGYQIGYLPDRLRAVFGDTKILLVIREQRAALISRYLANVRIGLLSKFKPWVLRCQKDQKLNFLKYSKLIEAYQRAFGSENVVVTLFEELMRPEVLKRTLEALGAGGLDVESVDWGERTHASLSLPAHHATKLVNRLFGSKYSHDVNVGRAEELRVYNLWRDKLCPRLDSACRRVGFGTPGVGFAGYEELVRELCSEDNEQVKALTGLDLQANGYL